MGHENINLQSLVTELYGQQLRVRACGLLRDHNRLLLVKHRGIGTSGTFWAPPGGGIEFGETASTALKREFLEETGLIIDVGRLVFVYEFVSSPLHAIELFFEVEQVCGQLQVGIDPEMNSTDQLIHDVQLLTFDQIKELATNEMHGLFSRCESLDEVFRLNGYIFNV